jgi:hypothetical protein
VLRNALPTLRHDCSGTGREEWGTTHATRRFHVAAGPIRSQPRRLPTPLVVRTNGIQESSLGAAGLPGRRRNPHGSSSILLYCGLPVGHILPISRGQAASVPVYTRKRKQREDAQQQRFEAFWCASAVQEFGSAADVPPSRPSLSVREPGKTHAVETPQGRRKAPLSSFMGPVSVPPAVCSGLPRAGAGSFAGSLSGSAPGRRRTPAGNACRHDQSRSSGTVGPDVDSRLPYPTFGRQPYLLRTSRIPRVLS